jgi:hypothetical protein
MQVSIIIENPFVQKWPSLQIADVVPPSWFVIEHFKVEIVLSVKHSCH